MSESLGVSLPAFIGPYEDERALPEYHTSAERPCTTYAEYVAQRSLEILPGTLVWAVMAIPFALFFFVPGVAAYAFFAYLAYWVVRSLEMAARQICEYRVMLLYRRVDWRARLERLREPHSSILSLSKKRGGVTGVANREELSALRAFVSGGRGLSPDEVYHLVVLTAYNEDVEILEQSLEAIRKADYPGERIVVCLAVEERSRKWTAEKLGSMRARYRDAFAMFLTTVHPDGIRGEGRVKGANLTWAARSAREELHRRGIADEQVIVSAFDADTRAGRDYFSILSYKHLTNPDRDVDSYQPILLFHNNVWDVPAVSRLVGFCSTFWTMIESTRPSRMRIFSSHAIGMKALVAVDYWSVAVIPDDSRQYWRMFFASGGRSRVVPLHTPVYLDSVLSSGLFATMKEQYLQLRRWAYGIIDFPYIVDRGLAGRGSVPLHLSVLQTIRQVSQFNTWATAPFLLFIVPQLLWRLASEGRHAFSAQLLAAAADTMLLLMPLGLIVSSVVSILMLPPRPAHRSRWNRLKFAAEWLALPLVLPLFVCWPAIDAQTRLIFRRYMGFRVTVKARRSPGHEVL